MNPETGWWENDNGSCYCVYQDRCGSEITRGVSFFARGTFMIHRCDIPRTCGVFDVADWCWPYNEIICAESLRPLARTGLPRWRKRMRLKNDHHYLLGRFQTLREWTKMTICTVLNSSDTACTQQLQLLGIRWRRVVRVYTKIQQVAYDPLFADTILYLPLDTLVFPSMSLAPLGVDPVGWLWAECKIPGSAVSVMGWIHPNVLAP